MRCCLDRCLDSASAPVINFTSLEERDREQV